MEWKETDLSSLCGYGRGLVLMHSTARVWLRPADGDQFSLRETRHWQIKAELRHPFAAGCVAEIQVAPTPGSMGTNLFQGSAREAQIHGEQALRFLCDWVGLKLPEEVEGLYDA
jgi:hypothetical protein